MARVPTLALALEPCPQLLRLARNDRESLHPTYIVLLTPSRTAWQENGRDNVWGGFMIFGHRQAVALSPGSTPAEMPVAISDSDSHDVVVFS
jgi:hypothetical protein